MRIKVTGPTLPVLVSLLWTFGIVIEHIGRLKGNESSMLHEETLQKEQGRQREEFLRDWLKDVGVEGKKESESGSKCIGGR